MKQWMVDCIGLCGVAMVVGGVAWIHAPAGLITAGTIFISAAVLWARRPKVEDSE